MLEISEEDKIIERFDNLKEKDIILPNGRNRELKVKDVFFAQNPKSKKKKGAPYKYLILRGYGRNYLVTVYDRLRPYIYTNSNYKILPDGMGNRVKTNMGAEILECRFNIWGICSNCERKQFYDNDSEEWYCAVCCRS